ncbi:MBL fold metallo-hydrolase [Streptomyces sp. NBC_01089]|uniref:MBL fold metallo-hydrolase n=1 Tax=Streptomyces sp. NBC_01089 TaxID=2903747 RepID=UPI00386E64E8|nr:MBL fold metallo-hydrolase [Streptomyces sp. NBC_01089]
MAPYSRRTALRGAVAAGAGALGMSVPVAPAAADPGAVRLTVLGSAGAVPTKTEPCSGYLLECAGYRLILDLGYAAFPALLRHCRPDDIDAVLITHRHPDHVADLSPFLRERAFLREPGLPPVPLYAPPGALDPVLGLDRADFLGKPYTVHAIDPPSTLRLGPFRVDTVSLPHFEPNVGFRISAGGVTVAYTGDSGPVEQLATLARDADLFLAQAMYITQVPEQDRGYMCSAVEAGHFATEAGAAELMLTHLYLMQGVTPAEAKAAARTTYRGPITVARSGLVWSRRMRQPS